MTAAAYPDGVTGPYLQAALFVERVLHERDGVLSFVRIVDRLAVQAHGDAPEELPEGATAKVTLAVMLKSGDARGRHRLMIRPELPSGLQLEPRGFDVLFEGEDRGVNVVVDLDVALMEGLHWFTVSLAERELTRVPLRIAYQRLT